MLAHELWEQFTRKYNVNETSYGTWAFGVDGNQLAELVLQGIKTATSSAYIFYELEEEPLPKVGQYHIILNDKEEATCVIQITKVSILPFEQVTEEHAYKEGEGDRTLDYWKKVHQAFFTEELRQVNMQFQEDMKVVCEEFKVLLKA